MKNIASYYKVARRAELRLRQQAVGSELVQPPRKRGRIAISSDP